MSSHPTASDLPSVGPAPRIDRLDGLRALCVAGVMAHHLVWASPSAAGWALGGWVGLDGFFVLSGFLITGLLLGEQRATGGVGLGRFWVRRVLRLYPAMLVALAAMAYVSVAVNELAWSQVWPTVKPALLYAVNRPFGHNEALLLEYTHFWSLAVEFQFYLGLPLALLVLARARVPSWVLPTTVVAVMAGVWWHRSNVWTGAESFPGAYVFTETRLDSLLWGVLVAIALQRGWVGARHRLVLWALAIPALAWLVWVGWSADSRSDWIYSWGLTANGLAAAVVVAWVILDADNLLVRGLGLAPLRWLGLRSYSLYLYHYPIYFFTTATMSEHLTSLQRVAVALFLSGAVAELSYRLVEQPGYRLRHRLTPSPARMVLPLGDAASSRT